jgi:hypothetical protein
VKKIFWLSLFLTLASFIFAQVNAPIKFTNKNITEATYLKLTEEIVDFDNAGKFEFGKYYVFTGDIIGYSGNNYRLDIGTIRQGGDYMQITLNVTIDSIPEWITYFKRGNVFLVTPARDGRLHVVEMIRDRPVMPDMDGAVWPQASTLENWITGVYDANAGKPEFDFIRNKTGQTITKYNKTEATVTIPNQIEGINVTIIGTEAFSGRTPASVIIPNSVITIENGAFRRCSLQSITIPDSVTIIGDDAFYYNSLSSVQLSKNLTTIGKNAFSSNKLTSVTIPDSVTTIGDYVFSANSLSSVQLSKNLTTIGKYAFSSNKLITVTVPVNVRTIKDYAFSGNKTTLITIGDDVDMERNAFDFKFKEFYISNTMIAGTYSYNGSQWDYKP